MTAPELLTQATRPPFALKHPASIQHINVRKEGEEGNEALALDIKLKFQGVDRRLCAYFDDALEAFLWRGNTDALIIRNDHLAPVHYTTLIAGANVEIDGRNFIGVDVKKFVLTPKDGGVMDMTCSITFEAHADDVLWVSNRLRDEVAMRIEAQPDLFDISHSATTEQQIVRDVVGHLKDIGATVQQDAEGVVLHIGTNSNQP
jgi:hypothetical protein